MFKDLIDRAKRVAEQTLPEEVLDAGRKLGRSVAAYAPAPLAEVIHYVTGDEDAEEPPKADASQSPKSDAVTKPEPAAPRREDPRTVLERVKTKAEHGLKPEDRLVVIYHDGEQDEDVAAIKKILESVEAEVRENDLRREPQTARQLAELTGVMVPPYVFINGKHWGARYDLEALAVDGDLEPVVANRLDEISEEARRIGHVHESFSDEISVDNIIDRWKRGHILCVDDLDSWVETDRDGTQRFYYQGGPHPLEEMRSVAEQIERGVEAEEFEAVWMLEPSVHLP
ncbi:MAG: glutaredoxin domain-containing protein [Nannocystaceae bacterium]